MSAVFIGPVQKMLTVTAVHVLRRQCKKVLSCSSVVQHLEALEHNRTVLKRQTTVQVQLVGLSVCVCVFARAHARARVRERETESERERESWGIILL